MEIHPGHHPILTLKEALVQLGIVTIGIVIALSFEGALEWSHHRALVREARHNLENEIRNNQKDIQLVLKSLKAVRPRVVHALDVVGNLSAPGQLGEAAALFSTAGPNTLLDGYTVATLNTASRTTAEMSGALEFMTYGEIRKYAEIYEPQSIFSRAQDSTLKDAMIAVSYGSSMLGKPGAVEIEDMKRQLRLVLAGFSELEIFAKALDQKYSEALKESSP